MRTIFMVNDVTALVEMQFLKCHGMTCLSILKRFDVHARHWILFETNICMT